MAITPSRRFRKDGTEFFLVQFRTGANPRPTSQRFSTVERAMDFIGSSGFGVWVGVWFFGVLVGVGEEAWFLS